MPGSAIILRIAYTSIIKKAFYEIICPQGRNYRDAHLQEVALIQMSPSSNAIKRIF